MKQLVIIAIIAVGGFLVYQNMPGLKSKANEIIDNATAWSPEDIKARPIEYIDHAKGQLKDNIGKFEAALAESDTNHQENVKQLERFAEQEQIGTAATNEMKVLFQRTEEDGSWPVTYNGKEYTQDNFIAQVERLLGDKKNASKQIAQYQKLVDGGSTQKRQIEMRIAELQRAITDLEAQKQGIKTAKLTDASEAILLSVNQIVDGSNTQVAKKEILSLEEFSMAKSKAEAEAAATAAEEKAKQEILDFLKS